MATVVQICNMALNRIGITTQIEDLENERSEAAIQCRLFYEPMRDLVLEDHDWPFARQRRALALVEEEPNTDWLFSYRYPTDCVAARYIVNPLGRQGVYTQPIPFLIGADDTARLIFTDEEDAVLAYTRRVTNPSYFSSSFVSALAWRLAIELAGPRTKLKQARQAAQAAYDEAITTAVARAANEGQDDAAPEAEAVRVRD